MNFLKKEISSSSQKKKGRGVTVLKLVDGGWVSKTIPAQLFLLPLALSMYNAVPTSWGWWYGPRRRQARDLIAHFSDELLRLYKVSADGSTMGTVEVM